MDDGDAMEVPNVRTSCAHTGVFVVILRAGRVYACTRARARSGRRREGETRVDVVETEFGVEKGALDVFHRDS